MSLFKSWIGRNNLIHKLSKQTGYVYIMVSLALKGQLQTILNYQTLSSGVNI